MTKPDEETLKSFFYSKGALDYRDKILAVVNEAVHHSTASDIFYLLVNTFPDDYPTK